MSKRINSIFVIGILIIAMTACGKEDEKPTPAPATVETVKAVSEQAVSASAAEAVSGGAASGDAVSETEEPFVLDEGFPEFEAKDIKVLLDACIGIKESSGYFAKCAKAADTLLAFAVENNLANQIDLSIQSFNAAFEQAYNELSFDQQKELYINLTEDIMPMIMDSFQDPDAYKGDFEDAGVYKSIKKNLKDPDARASWTVIWEEYNSLTKDKQKDFASEE